MSQFWGGRVKKWGKQKQAGYICSLPEIFIAVDYKLKAVVLLLAKSLLALFGNGNGLRLKLAPTFLDKSYHKKGIK
jgi:hypothetical protein